MRILALVVAAALLAACSPPVLRDTLAPLTSPRPEPRPEAL